VPFRQIRASKFFIIVFQGNLSNSLDFFIHSITPQSSFHGPAPFFAGFHPIRSVLFAFGADTQTLLLNVPIRPISTVTQPLNWFLQVSTRSLSFSIRFLRLFFHPVLLTKVVISTPDVPNSDEWPRRYGIQQSIHSYIIEQDTLRIPIVYRIVSFCGRFYCLGASLRPLIHAT
jgi:hypothetical protein